MSGKKSLAVLLVEDNPGDAKLVEHYLESSDATHFVDDIALTHLESLTAVEELDTDGYDVLLLDLGLPKSSGLETLDRADEMVEKLPIIVLTGMQDSEKSMDAIEQGAQDYLPKSELDGDRLVRSLRYAVVRSRQQQTLRRRRDQMEFFNSILQHDMLNGMNVIRARGDVLIENLEGDDKEYAETIVNWSDDIIDLTEKVRSVLKTLSEDGINDMQQRDLEIVLDAAADRARSMSPACTVNNHVTDIEVAADELLEDVFGNLFLNAVEHGGGDVTIDVTASVKDVLVEVRIADDGPGIEPPRRRRVFERGQKGAGSSGTGFGLYFVDSMVESYGGNIWIEDAEGLRPSGSRPQADDSDSGGAAFVLELPRTE